MIIAEGGHKVKGQGHRHTLARWTDTHHVCYYSGMGNFTESAILDKMLEPVARCFTPAVAQQSAELWADPTTQVRIDELAAMCNEGALTEEEQREYGA